MKITIGREVNKIFLRFLLLILPVIFVFPGQVYGFESEASQSDPAPKNARPKPTLTVFYIPVMGMKADEDENEPNLGIEFDADLKAGSGWGGRIGTADLGINYYGKDPFAILDIGLLYLTTQHDEKSTSSHVRTDAVYLEFLLVGVSDSGPAQWTSSFGLGVGGAGLNFSRTFDDTKALAGEVRAEIGLEFWNHLKLQAGMGAFVWGYPTETIGYGGFATFSAGVLF